ncbi:hypothetical protein [Prosthecobacter dejongeii]|uniref:Uncharacterized protein n=1 Tax=Prosthecobacter dejongeii TaxID=48465 RepID=A0A7W8DNW2_9BACT|nr:hypothetical protein [Prosthecobacter dejongeii]MBB5036515.1 hypothetical protein [Prosthecobacter dejongeii]
MKTFAPLLIVLIAVASAQAETLEKISTLRGKTYRQCEIVKVHPDGVSFTHANGAAKILFTDLSQEWRTRLGYDPAKAKAYQRDQEERRLAQAALRRQQEEARGEALLMAQQIELARLRGIEVQARAELEAAAKAPPPNPPLVPEVTPLGAVFDSRDYRGVGYRDRSPGYGYGYGYGYPYYSGYLGGGYGTPYCPPHVHGGVRGRVGGVTFRISR